MRLIERIKAAFDVLSGRKCAISVADFSALYWRFEAVASAVDKCRLRRPQRERVDAAVSKFRRAVIGLARNKKTSGGCPEAEKKNK